MLKETMSLKATFEPRIIRDSRTETSVVMRIE